MEHLLQRSDAKHNVHGRVVDCAKFLRRIDTEIDAITIRRGVHLTPSDVDHPGRNVGSDQLRKSGGQIGQMNGGAAADLKKYSRPSFATAEDQLQPVFE